MPLPERIDWRCLRLRVTRAATRRSSRSKSTARTLRHRGILHDLHRLEYFDHRDESRLRGWKSVHITDGDHPYMKNWWVPGLQIGYEHTFIHQVADFLSALGEGKPAAPTFRDGLATDYVTDAVLKSAKSKQWEKVLRLIELDQSFRISEGERMFSLLTNVRMKTGSVLVGVVVLAMALAYIFPAVHAAAPQQPAPAAGQQAPAAGAAAGAPAGRGGGGGFSQPAPIDFDDHDGFVSLFDGSTLNNWTSDGTNWSVKDGSIYSVSTCEKPTGTIYIYLRHWPGRRI